MSGTAVNPHEWRSSLNAGGAIWALDFDVTSRGTRYTFTASHSESGHWQTSPGHLHFVSNVGVITDGSYALVSPGRLSWTLGNQPVVFRTG